VERGDSPSGCLHNFWRTFVRTSAACIRRIDPRQRQLTTICEIANAAQWRIINKIAEIAAHIMCSFTFRCASSFRCFFFLSPASCWHKSLRKSVSAPPHLVDCRGNITHTTWLTQVNVGVVKFFSLSRALCCTEIARFWKGGGSYVAPPAKTLVCSLCADASCTS